MSKMICVDDLVTIEKISGDEHLIISVPKRKELAHISLIHVSARLDGLRAKRARTGGPV